MMDPVTATIISAATLLGTEVVKGVGGEAAKGIWNKVKGLLGFTKEPDPATLETDITQAISAQPQDRLKELVLLLQSQPKSNWGQLVGHINAEKVIVVGEIHGDFTATM